MTSIETGTVHVVIVKNRETIESRTFPNKILAAQWMFVNECPLRKKQRKDFCDRLRQFANDLERP
jgi:hypothetical protein